MSGRIRVLELRSVRGTGGGPEKTILLGAAAADRARFEVSVCYIRDRRDRVFRLGERAAELGVDYVEVHERHSFDPGIWPQLRRIVRDRGIDIVHAHEYKTDFIAYMLGRRTGIIPFATAHAWTGNTLRERLLYYPVDKRLLARFPHVVAVSTEIKNDLQRCGALDNQVTVILNSIDPVLFKRVGTLRSEIRARLEFQDSDIVIGAVGRLEHQKRFDLLLQAFGGLLHEEPRLRVVIVGDGTQRSSLAALSRQLGLDGRCSFLGQRDDIVSLHHAFDLFIQSSDYEGTPNAVLEAMAMETPVIATDVGGTRELVEPDLHGIIIPRRDVPALQNAVRRVLGDPGTTRMRVQAARQRVETDLSFDARTRRLERLYAKLEAEKSRHA